MNWEALLFFVAGTALLAFAWDRIFSLLVRVPSKTSVLLYRDETLSRVLMPGFHLKSRGEVARFRVDLSEKVVGSIRLPTVFMPDARRVTGTFRFHVTEPEKFILLRNDQVRAIMALVAGNSITAKEMNALIDDGHAITTPIRADNQTNDLGHGFEITEIKLFFEK